MNSRLEGGTLGVVVATIGRAKSLLLLLSSLVEMDCVSNVVLVDQSSTGDLRLRLEHLRGQSKFEYVSDVGCRGLSRARNIGVASLPIGVPFVMFIDDDCTVDEGSLHRAIEALSLPRAGAVAGRVVSQQKRAAFRDATCILDRRSVWTSAMEAALVVRRDAFDEAGGFDEELGIGAATPFQSGEGTDLLLRIMDNRVVYYQPEYVVTEFTAVPSRLEIRRKAALYGRGTARVYHLHYRWFSCSKTLAAPLARLLFAIFRGRFDSALQQSCVLWGRLSGFLLSAERGKARILPNRPLQDH